MSNNYSGESRYAPLSPWAYFGLQILYGIPVIGLIFLIIFSINGSNINRRNFSRSYFCVLIIVLVLIGIALIFGGGTAVVETILDALKINL